MPSYLWEVGTSCIRRCARFLGETLVGLAMLSFYEVVYGENSDPRYRNFITMLQTLFPTPAPDMGHDDNWVPVAKRGRPRVKHDGLTARTRDAAPVKSKTLYPIQQLMPTDAFHREIPMCEILDMPEALDMSRTMQRINKAEERRVRFADMLDDNSGLGGALGDLGGSIKRAVLAIDDIPLTTPTIETPSPSETGSESETDLDEFGEPSTFIDKGKGIEIAKHHMNGFRNKQIEAATGKASPDIVISSS
ncbi:hypothetical protein AAE478_001740 [Parahypoxylon ruwenzoriense]